MSLQTQYISIGMEEKLNSIYLGISYTKGWDIMMQYMYVLKRIEVLTVSIENRESQQSVYRKDEKS